MKNKTILFSIFLASIALCTIMLSGCTKSGTKKLVDAPKGYSISVPADMTYDFSLAKSYTKCMNSNME